MSILPVSMTLQVWCEYYLVLVALPRFSVDFHNVYVAKFKIVRYSPKSTLQLFFSQLVNTCWKWNVLIDLLLPYSVNFNIMKTNTFTSFSACWLFCCFHNPPNSDMDYKFFNVYMRFFFWRVYTHGGHKAHTSLILRTFVESAQNLTPEKSRSGHKA